MGMVLGRRKCGATCSSVTSAVHRAPPTPGRHQPLLSGSSSPVLPIGTVTSVPTVWELPGTRTLVGSQQKQKTVLSPREKC